MDTLVVVEVLVLLMTHLIKVQQTLDDLVVEEVEVLVFPLELVVLKELVVSMDLV